MAIRDLVPKLGRGRESRMPVRHGEFAPLYDFQREMNRLFDDFFGDFAPVPRWGEGDLMPATFSPKVDLSETDKDLSLSVELPGLDEKDVSVEMDDQSITIRGEKKAEKEEKGKNWYRREQSYGSFSRVVALPANVEKDKATAKFKKGVLSITVPKREGEQPKRKAITIETN